MSWDHRNGREVEALGPVQSALDVVVPAHELAKVEMLLDPAKQQLDLPSPLVESRNLNRGAFEIVGDESDRLAPNHPRNLAMSVVWGDPEELCSV
jgi:hypothetical protein